ncbi:chloride channel [Aureococcus anophagefferens]|nr:chloride channel [Aureococcus anophagefferens]
MREWSAIAAAAGAPAPRLAEEKERLFGAAKPKVVFWRDNSMWCPYCARLWLLLEALRVPYTTKTIPLSRYLKPGEKKPAEYTSQVPSGVVPALQFEQADGTYGPAVDGVARLFDALLSDAATAAPPAVLPYFFGDGAFERLPFGRARAYLEGARARTFFGAIASDRTTLARTNLRYANPHFAPDAGAARLIDHEGVACTAEDRRDAAARLAKNHAAVAKFALRAASADNRPDETLVAAVDDALRATADSPRRRRQPAAGPPRVADAPRAVLQRRRAARHGPGARGRVPRRAARPRGPAGDAAARARRQVGDGGERGLLA